MRSARARVPVTHRAAVGTGASSPRPPGCLLRLLRSALRSSSRRSARGSPRRNICLCVMTPCLLHAATVRVSARSGSVEPAGRSGEAGPRCHRLTSPAGLTSHASVIVNISTSPCVNDAPIVCHASSSSLSFLWGLS